MEINVFSNLTEELSEKLKTFEWKNFYTQNQRTKEYQAQEQEKFCSQPRAWILTFQGDQIIGRVLLHERTIKFKKRQISLGGVGGVCTRKDKRNQGIASIMLREAIAILKEWDCDIAYLCTDIEKTGSLYSRVGFVPLNKPYSFYGRSGKLHEQHNGMIAPLNSRGIFEEVLHAQGMLHIGSGNW
jgi:predicted N-acetyltransferase YhbS